MQNFEEEEKIIFSQKMTSSGFQTTISISPIKSFLNKGESEDEDEPQKILFAAKNSKELLFLKDMTGGSIMKNGADVFPLLEFSKFLLKIFF